MGIFQQFRWRFGGKPRHTEKPDTVAGNAGEEYAVPPDEKYPPYANTLDHINDELRYAQYILNTYFAKLSYYRTLGELPPAEWRIEPDFEKLFDDEMDQDTYPDGFDPRAVRKKEYDTLKKRMYDKAAEIKARLYATDWQQNENQRRADGTPQPRKKPERRLNLRLLEEFYKLNRSERSALMLCLLSDTDMHTHRDFGLLMHDEFRKRPDVRLILTLLEVALPDEPRNDDASKLMPKEAASKNSIDSVKPSELRRLFAPNAALLSNHLVVLEGDGSLLDNAVRLDERVANFLQDTDALETEASSIDSRIVGFVREIQPSTDQNAILTWGDVSRDRKRRQTLQKLVSSLLDDYHKQPYNKPPISASFFLRGEYGSPALITAQVITSELDRDRTMLIVDVGKALSSGLDWTEVVSRCLREARFQHTAAVYWQGCEALIEAEELYAQWVHLLAATAHYQGLSLLESRRVWLPPHDFHERLPINIELPLPSYRERRQLWIKYLLRVGQLDTKIDWPALILSLANSFQFTDGQIRDAVNGAKNLAISRDGIQGRMREADLYAACRAQTSNRIGGLAQRIKPRSITLDHMVLPSVSKVQLTELLNRIQYRNYLITDMGFGSRFQLGLGLLVLFTGSSGTGKTMAAELLANAIGVDVFRVDLSAVVSKYVGETEKNFNKLLNEAEGTNAILFFDEADALFGKRGEVKEAQDRWANMEVNYLLQRIEQYSGVVVLASNLRQNIDEAFMRRIQVVVDFPFPDDTLREQLWAILIRDVQRFPDAQFHVVRNIDLTDQLDELLCSNPPPELKSVDYRRLCELKVDFSTRITLALNELSRDVLRRLLDPLISAMEPATRDEMLKEELRVLSERFRLAGGNIKNIVVDASVRALVDEQQSGKTQPVVRLRHLVAATAREYQKIGRPVTRGEFSDLFYDWVQEDLIQQQAN